LVGRVEDGFGVEDELGDWRKVERVEVELRGLARFGGSEY